MSSRTVMSLSIGILLTATQTVSLADTATPHRSGTHVNPAWSKLSIELPVSTTTFPAGEGASVANSQCLICHSVEMVSSQPQRSEAQWRETINKMRTVYGAPIPADQTDALAAYLARIVSSQ